MKYYSTTNDFKFSWHEVITCFWKRYPNPYSTHVTSEDTVWRKIVDGKLITQRLITKVSSVPKWAEMFTPGGSKKICVLEESIIDPKTKTLTTYTRNIGMTKVMTIDEKCIYTVDPTNKRSTKCERHAWVNSTLFGFSAAIKSFGVERFKKSIVKSVKGFEHILNLNYAPNIPRDQIKVLGLNTEKLKESKEKLKESAHKAKESAKELAQKSKSKSASVVV